MQNFVKIQDPLRAPVGCYNSVCLDPETVRYLDYDSDRACSAGTGSYALVTDTSAACLRTVTVCVHVLLATLFPDFPHWQIGDRV